MSISGRSTFSCIWITSAVGSSGATASALAAAAADEALGLQDLQRLAHRAGADVEGAGELGLGRQAVADLELAGQHLRLDGVDDGDVQPVALGRLPALGEGGTPRHRELTTR